MKTVVHIAFIANDIPGGPATILNPAGCGPDVSEVDEDSWLGIEVWVTLEITDRRLPVLRRLLKEQSGVSSAPPVSPLSVGLPSSSIEDADRLDRRAR